MLLVGLAGWRVSSLFVQEAGPFRIFERLRERVGLVEGEVSIQPEGLRGFLYGLLSCVWCLSIWVVPLMWVLFEVSGVATGIFAAMTVAVMVQQFVSRA